MVDRNLNRLVQTTQNLRRWPYGPRPVTMQQVVNAGYATTAALNAPDDGQQYARVFDHWEVVDVGTSTNSAPYRFQTGTAAPPGSANVRFDNAAPAAATNIFISDVTGDGTDIGNLMGLMRAGDEVYLQDRADSSIYQVFELTGPPVDGAIGGGGYHALPVAWQEGAGAFGNNEALTVSVISHGSGGGGGSVTSISAGTGITVSPSPITATGSISLTVPVSVANGGTGSTTAAAAPFVEVAGDTMTGSLSIVPPSGNASFTLTKPASGNLAQFVGNTGANARWAFVLGDLTAESGGNAGSNFGVSRFSDGGVFIDNPMVITRSTGKLTLTVAPDISNGASAATNGYVKLPNGLILQWGTAAGGAASVNVSFPIAFPTGVLNIQTTMAGDPGAAGLMCSAAIVSTTSFTAYPRYTTGATVGNATQTIYWMAIGY